MYNRQIIESDSYGQTAIALAETEKLETWDNPEVKNSYFIHIEHPEYTALCPRSGYPDMGTIVIDYVPNLLVAELKAIKLYINSFRDRKISHEAATNEIADKIFNDVKPKALQIIGDYTRRGGIKTVIHVFRGEKTNFPFNYEVKKL